MASSLIRWKGKSAHALKILTPPSSPLACLRLASSLIWWRKFPPLLLHRQSNVSNPRVHGVQRPRPRPPPSPSSLPLARQVATPLPAAAYPSLPCRTQSQEEELGPISLGRRRVIFFFFRPLSYGSRGRRWRGRETGEGGTPRSSLKARGGIDNTLCMREART